MIKVSILGDIMCEYPYLIAAASKNRSYDFSKTFNLLKKMLAESDFVIGNLETPITDKKKNLTRKKDQYSFNTPIQFAKSIKEAGVDLVLTANNHCYDRGYAGLLKTIDCLDKISLSHTGTFINEYESRFFSTCLKKQKIAIFSLTESTNCAITRKIPSNKNVNLLNKQLFGANESFFEKSKKYIIRNIIGFRNFTILKKKIGLYSNNEYIDNHINLRAVDRYLSSLKKQVCVAKNNSEIVIVCPHMGGQFNAKIGRLSEYIMNEISKMDVDIIVASHSHIIQKYKFLNNKPCFFSIGNVSMSMCTEYINKSNLPNYGATIHLYIDDNRIQSVTCSFIKMVETKDNYIIVTPVYDLYKISDSKDKRLIEKDIEIILKRMNILNYQSGFLIHEEYKII